MTGEKVGGCREQNSLYVNEIEDNKETIARECTNTLDLDNNSEPGS